MLVISRKSHEKILIPAIRACIHVAAVQPGVVRVAINAPPEVAILRGEVVDRAREWGQPLQQPPAPPTAPTIVPSKPRKSARRMRKRLRLACMTLGLARLQLLTGRNRQAAAMLGKMHRQLQALSFHLDGKKGKSLPCLAPTKSTPPPSGRSSSGRCVDLAGADC
jgi:carbon storage regulator CsrA